MQTQAVHITWVTNQGTVAILANKPWKQLLAATDSPLHFFRYLVITCTVFWFWMANIFSILWQVKAPDFLTFRLWGLFDAVTVKLCIPFLSASSRQFFNLTLTGDCQGWKSYITITHWVQGCPIFIGPWYQNRKNVPDEHKMFQMVIKYPKCLKYSKWSQHTYIHFFQSKALTNLPKFEFLVWKQTILQPWSGSYEIQELIGAIVGI
jgi:hypothetical protein